MKNWRTTLIGVLSAAVLLGIKVLQGHPIDSTDIMTALGLIGIGTASKDAAVHSTAPEVAQSTAAVQQKALDAAQK